MTTTATTTNVVDFPTHKEQRAKTPNTEAYGLPEVIRRANFLSDTILEEFSARLRYNKLIDAFTTTAATNEEGQIMDWQEKYLDKLDRDIGDMKSSLRATEERIEGMINQTMSEMRDRDGQRHTEILALRGDIQAIRTDNAETRRWVIGMVIGAIGVALAAIIGIVSVVIGN